MSSSPTASDIPVIPERVLDRLRCPKCAEGTLAQTEEALTCRKCDTRFPSHQGIPLLAVEGTAETWTGEMAPETSAEYQQEYRDLDEAKLYNEAYRDRATKRWSTQKEYRLLQQLLGSQPRSELLLDLPCGGGRLSGQLAGFTDVMVEADIGMGQLLYAREHYQGTEERFWMTASGFHIPLQDESMDGVVCCRLCHHLPTAEERERLLSELLRVSRRFVIMTYFDYHSVKNTLRRMRRPFDGQPPKMTMTTERVRELARQHGAELVAQPALSHLFSGHRYGLMVKR